MTNFSDVIQKSEGFDLIPSWLGEILFSGLLKGAGHKYIRRIPTGNPKRPWKYYYNVKGGGGVAHDDEIKVGAAFKVTHGGEEGHFHVTAVDGDKVTIRHDESGHVDTMSKAAFSKMVRDHHAEAIRDHHEKLKADWKAVQKHGSEKQQGRIQAELRQYGVSGEDPHAAKKKLRQTLRDAGLSGKAADAVLREVKAHVGTDASQGEHTRVVGLVAASVAGAPFSPSGARAAVKAAASPPKPKITEKRKSTPAVPVDVGSAPFGAIRNGRRVSFPFLPYALKDWAKDQGARWDTKKREWYVGTAKWAKVKDAFEARAAKGVDDRREEDARRRKAAEEAHADASKRQYLTGRTYDNREDIKRRGGRWDAERKQWWMTGEAFGRHAAKLSDYGVSGGDRPKREEVERPERKASASQVGYALALISRGAFDPANSTFGHTPPSKARLEGMTRERISMLIDGMRNEEEY